MLYITKYEILVADYWEHSHPIGSTFSFFRASCIIDEKNHLSQIIIAHDITYVTLSTKEKKRSNVRIFFFLLMVHSGKVEN